MFAKKRDQLVVPAEVKADPNATEVLRVWSAGGAQHVTLAAGMWDDPAAWGLLLVDIARHVSRAFHQADGRDSGEVLDRIRAGFEAEWDDPTDEPTGQLAS